MTENDTARRLRRIPIRDMISISEKDKDLFFTMNWIQYVQYMDHYGWLPSEFLDARKLVDGKGFL